MEIEDKVIKRFEDIVEGKLEEKEKHLNKTILLDHTMKPLAQAFKKRGFKSLQLAKFIKDFSKLENFRGDALDILKVVKIERFKKIEENWFDWVIEISYYGMYDLATAALSKEGIKSTTHYSTRLALEYVYCVEGKEREKLFKIYDRVLLRKEVIEKLKTGLDKREIARYHKPSDITEADAIEQLEDAEEFRKEIIKVWEEK